MSKVKILVFGEIGENADIFLKKLIALHQSKAGPFDAAFVVGSCQDLTPLLKPQQPTSSSSSSSSSLPLPLYLHHVVSLPLESKPEVREDSPCELAPNLYVLVPPPDQPAGIWSIPIGKDKLVVAACPPHVRVDSEAAKPLMDKLQHVSYRGCDILLTQELPQGAQHLLREGPTIAGGAYDVADVALRARARYHFVPSSTYQQSQPFRHLSSSTSTIPILHTGRLITLATVSSSKDKAVKCVHALGMCPLLSMSTIELHQQQQQAGLLPCPYTDTSYPTDDDPNRDYRATQSSMSHHATTGLSEASARRIRAEEQSQKGGGGSTALAQRWTTGQKRRRDNQQPHDEQDEVVDPTNTTLFVHGLHKDVTGRLQSHDPGDVLLLQAFSKWKAIRVRKPPNAATSSFAFVEFTSHELAVQCLEETGRETTILGVHLALKWATNSSSDGASGPTNKKRKDDRLTEAQAKDSHTLYFKLVQMEFNETTGEAMRRWTESILEVALNENVENSNDFVTASDEPALRVEVRVMSAFGFLDFASHAAASMAIATLTGSVDGGVVLEEAQHRPEPLKEAIIYMHWAHSKEPQPDRDDKNIIEDATGFQFERKHFPPDSRQDCWFCLASEGCEKHLITAVFDQCYAAMPKGPVHPGHVLLIPVQHSSQGSLVDSKVAEEMEDIKRKLRHHASTAYDCELFVFERAIQTKGGYHTHVQCIPVERQLGTRLLTTMLTQGSKAGMELREIKSDIAVSSLLDQDDDEVSGYFYAEIPSTGTSYRRFLHRQSADSQGRVPLQFGREILAAVLGKADLAHWKSCVLEADEEAALALELRNSFAKVEGERTV